MVPVHSVLKILDFSVLQMDFEVVTPKKEADRHINPTLYFDQYELDLDFSGLEHEYFQVTMSVEINCGASPLPGYRISAQVATIFHFGDISSITADEKRSMEGYSTVYMALNNLRGVIAGFTANAPFGKYMLPSVDLNDLIKKKRELKRSEVSIQPPKTPTKIIKKRKMKK